MHFGYHTVVKYYLRKITPPINFNTWSIIAWGLFTKQRRIEKRVDLCKLNWQVQGIKIGVHNIFQRFVIFPQCVEKVVGYDMILSFPTWWRLYYSISSCLTISTFPAIPWPFPEKLNWKSLFILHNSEIEFPFLVVFSLYSYCLKITKK